MLGLALTLKTTSLGLISSRGATTISLAALGLRLGTVTRDAFIVLGVDNDADQLHSQITQM